MYKNIILMFILHLSIGIIFNPMNVLANKFSDIYLSNTLIYSSLLMVSNMLWSRELTNYLFLNKIDIYKLVIGVFMAFFIAIVCLRNQLFIDDKQWLRRMISHHSTAITTSKLIKVRTNNPKVKKLSENIINTQKKEITLMKKLLSDYY